MGSQTAMDFQRLDPEGETQNTIVSSNEKTSAASSCTRPKVDVAMVQSSQEAYLRLFRTAYNLAVAGMPLESFTTMVKTQKENGLQLIKGDSDLSFSI